MRRALAILLLMGFFRPLLAEEEPAPFRIEVGGIVRVDDVSNELSGTARAIIGPLRFSWPGLYSIEAERLLIWFDPRVDTKLFQILDRLNEKQGEIPIWAIRAIYAEGSGKVPLVFQAGGQVLRASSMYYDLQRHEGLFLGTELRIRRQSSAAIEEKLPDLVFRAKQFRARGPGRWTAHDVSLFSSDYVKPEVELRIRELDIENEQVRRALGKLMLLSARGEPTMGGPTAEEIQTLDDELSDVTETQRGTWGTMSGIRVRGFGVPLFGWKRLNLNGSSLDKTVVRVQAGRIQSMGSGVYVAAGKRSRPVGWLLGAGWVNDRGPLIDTQIELDTWNGKATGRTLASYFHDDKRVDFDGFVAPSENRYWLQNRYRFQLMEKLRFDLEYTLISDAHYLRIYDEREFKEGKDQESLGYLRWKDTWFYASLIYQWQSIDFLAVKEQLPSARVSVPNATLLQLGEDGQGRPILLQLGLDTQLGNFRYRGGDEAPGLEFRTPRYDLDPTLYVAFNLGPVRFTPFATFRYTWYDETLDGSSANRYAGSAGIRADMQLSRWFGDVQHIVNFRLGYEDLYSVTTSASDIFQMDPVDAITPWEGLIARMRNRFLKKTPQGRREFLNFELLGTWFPNGQAPLGRSSDGYIELDLQWYPAPGWLVETRAEYFSNDGTLQTGSVVGRWGANADVSFWAGFRHLHDDSDVVTGGGEFLVEERWRIVLFSQYDIKNDDALNQTLTLQRMGKTFLIGCRLNYHPGEDRLNFSFKFDLLERFRSERRKRAEEELRREVRYNPRNGG
jgi:hypothetical protein